MAGAYNAARAPGREHIPTYPKNFIAVRIIQLIFTVIVLALAAYGVYWYPFSGDSLMLAVSLMCLITSIYHIVAEFGAPHIYNYWAVLALDIFMLIMWLIAFALLASQVAFFFAVTVSYSYYYGYSYNSLSGSDYVAAACLATAAGLGAIEFILHIVSLAIHSVALHRHRAAGLHNMPGGVDPSPGAYGLEKGVGPVSSQQQPQQPQQYVFPPQQQQQFVTHPTPVYNGVQPQEQYGMHQQQQPYGGSPPPQQYIAPPPQQQQQQQFYGQSVPHQTPSPVVSHPTGGSYGGQSHSQSPMPAAAQLASNQAEQ